MKANTKTKNKLNRLMREKKNKTLLQQQECKNENQRKSKENENMVPTNIQKRPWRQTQRT